MEKFFKTIAECFSSVNKNITSRRNVQLSVISLFMAVMVMVVSCVCWYSLNNTADSGRMTVNAGNGLVLNGGEGTSTLTVDEDVTLLPASSVDGYNLYFPADGFFTSNVSEIIYRRANAGDKNKTFIQFDFTLASEVGKADVYLDKNSSIKLTKIKDGEVTEAYTSALRIAIFSGLANSPKILNPTTDSKTIGAAVADISRFTGALPATGGTNEQTSDSISSSAPIITLKAGETSNISIVIWLEGTDPACAGTFDPEAEYKIDFNFNLTCQKPQ